VHDPAMLGIAVHGNPPAPNVFFAAVQYLLMTGSQDAPLRHFYPNLVADPLPSSGAWPAFRAFCLERRSAIHQLITTRYVQTNEPARSSYLLPAFHVAHQLGDGRPLALIEVGCSAGLNLCFDCFTYHSADGLRYGAPESTLTLDVELRGHRRPNLPHAPTPIARRIGIDLQPIRLADRDQTRWLEALVWPEQHERRQQLLLALGIASQMPLELHAGDASHMIGDILATISAQHLPCIFQTHVLNQFPDDARARLFRAIDFASQHRPLVFISREAQLTLDFYQCGNRREVVLANTDVHGKWIEWLHDPAAMA
jgi:hypothetical protein